MLVLSRHKGERIRVGTDIIVELVELRGDKARIGIAAPAHVPVDREEVFESKVTDGLKTISADSTFSRLSALLEQHKHYTLGDGYTIGKTDDGWITYRNNWATDWVDSGHDPRAQTHHPTALAAAAHVEKLKADDLLGVKP